MFELQGYTVGKRLRSSASGDLYRAIRNEDHARVVLKLYDPSQHEDAQARAQHELDLLRRVQAPGIVRALRLESSESGPVVVLSELSGIPLCSHVDETGPLRAEPFLQIALAATEAVWAMHEAGILHRAIEPRNWLVDPRHLTLQLVNFDLAVAFGAGDQAAGRASFVAPEVPLRYMAPEQTGRMDRGADFRSDLYALGGTFYFLLTGQPPFADADPLALIHAHAARRPIPPAERLPQVPTALSRIVMKLLEKEPEQRYQRAGALQLDLEACRQQLERSGQIDSNLPLGKADAPYRPVFPRRLHGRESQIQTLNQAYDRVSRGTPEMLLITGPPGVGKSALVDSLRSRALRDDGAFAYGKFDPYRREQPYSGFVNAFNSLIDPWLLESDESLSIRAEELRSALGSIAGALLEIVPALRMVLGEVPAVPSMGSQETQARLALAVQRFVRACAQPGHPLVLLLDDLQWSDAGSRFLLESILGGRSPGAVLVLATCRDNEQEGHDPVGALISRLEQSRVRVRRTELSSLTLDATAEMLASALRRRPEDTRRLAQHVGRKTGYNPLLIQHFVDLMFEREVLRYDTHSGWMWDEPAIEAADIPDSAVGLLTATIERLEKPLRQLVARASCLGGVFDLEALRDAHAGDPELLESQLHQLCDAGLITPCRGGFRFSHDRIRETARDQLSEAERSALHHQTGLLLLNRTAPEDLAKRSLEIADHLNRARHLLSEDEQERLLQINLVAGRCGLRAGAGGTAMRYFEHARALFAESRWNTDPHIGFDLVYSSATAAVQTRDLDQAMRLIAELEARPISTLQWGLVTMLRISIHALTLSPEQTFLHAQKALRQLGVRWPSHPSRLRVWMEIVHADWCVRRFLARAQNPVMPPERDAASLLIIPVASPSISETSRSLAMLSTTYSVRTMVRSKFITGMVLILFGAYQYGFSGDAKRMRRYAELGLERAMKYEDTMTQLVARFDVLALVHPWLLPRRTSIKPLRDLAVAAAEIGVRQLEQLALGVAGKLALFSGEPLPRVQDDLFASSVQTEQLWELTALFTLLRDRTADLESLPLVLDQVESAPSSRKSPWARGPVWVTWMMGLCILGQHVELWERTRSRGDFFERDPGSTHVADLCLFRGISAAELATRARGVRRREYRRVLRQDEGRLRRWARNGPDFVHMTCLLQAERARLRRRFDRALALYEQAARRAEQQGYIHHTALAHERRALLLRAQEREPEARVALAEAIRRYRAWGADGKVAQLESLSAVTTH